MKKLIVVIFFLINILFAFSQELPLGLQKQYQETKEMSGKEKSNKLVEIGLILLQNKEFDSLIRIADELEKNIGYKEDKMFVSIAYVFKGTCMLEQKKYETAINYFLLTLENYKGTTNQLVELSKVYDLLIKSAFYNKSERRYEYLEEGLDYLNADQDSLRADYYYNVASIESSQDLFNSALKSLNNAKMEIDDKYPKLQFKIAMLKAQIFNNLDNYNESTKNCIFALSLLEPEEYELQYKVHLTLASVYRKLDNHTESLKHAQKASALSYKLDNDRKKANSENYIGLAYKNLEKYDEAEKHFEHAIEANKKLNISYATPLANLGQIYNKKQMYQKALTVYDSVLTMFKKEYKAFGITATLINKAEVLVVLNELNEAKDLVNKALTLANLLKSQDAILNCYELLIKISIAENNYENGFNYQKKMNELIILEKDKKMNKSLLEMKEKFETNQIQTENEHLKISNELHLREKKLYRRLVVMIVLFLVFLIAFLYLLNKKYKLAAKLHKQALEDNKTIISQQNKLKKIHAELEISENKFRLLFQDSKDALFIIQDEKIIECNHSCVELLQVRKMEDIIGKSLDEFSADEQENKYSKQQMFAKQMEKVDKFQFANFEWILLINNEHIHLDITMNAINIDNIEYEYLICRNITEQRKLEKQRDIIQNNLISYSRMLTLSEITSGIAHEINQPLTYINTLVQTSIIDLESGSSNEILERLLPVSEQIDKISKRINYLRHFGQTFTNEFIVVSFNDLFKNTLLLLEGILDENDIKIQNNLPVKLPRFSGLPQQIEQLLMNLFHNSFEALRKVKHDKLISISSEIKDNYLWIIIEDNGIGMSNETLEKAFFPFYTTKEASVGDTNTGLGLPIGKTIVEKHGGKIELISTLGVGTKIQFSLLLNSITRPNSSNYS